MNYHALGQTGLSVSEIGFGRGIGGRTIGTTLVRRDIDDRTTVPQSPPLRAALDAGIAFFDTSAAYGNGLSEELIGPAFKGAARKRSSPPKQANEALDRPPDFSAAAITAFTAASLQRLDSDYVDLLHLHMRPRPGCSPITCGRPGRLFASSKIRAWGTSNKSPAEAFEARPK